MQKIMHSLSILCCKISFIHSLFYVTHLCVFILQLATLSHNSFVASLCFVCWIQIYSLMIFFVHPLSIYYSIVQFICACYSTLLCGFTSIATTPLCNLRTFDFVTKIVQIVDFSSGMCSYSLLTTRTLQYQPQIIMANCGRTCQSIQH